jgi:GNAT superfamily N-acetyltransferase
VSPIFHTRVVCGRHQIRGNARGPTQADRESSKEFSESVTGVLPKECGMGQESRPTIEIRKLQGICEAEICARMMTDSEPWTTLRQSYDTSLELVTDSSREVYLAFMEGEVTGFAILHLRGLFNGYIQAVCVKPNWRNKGIGSRLIVFSEERIFSETSNAFICVSSSSVNALRLYERLGYEAIGPLKGAEVLLRKSR